MVNKEGIIPDWKIKELIEKGIISNASKALVNPSSLDLRVGFNKYKLLGSFFPFSHQTVEDTLKSKSIVDDSEHKKKEFYLETGQPYLWSLVESLDLPKGINARIHNKSGRGRIGISTKGLVDRVSSFDVIPGGYKGPLYAEICATAFPIVVSSGEDPIPQVRFYYGNPQPIQGLDLMMLLRDHPVLTHDNGKPAYDEREKEEILRTGKFTFHADLSDAVYVAKRDRRNFDLSKKNHYEPSDFFESLHITEGEEKATVIHPGDFVLVRSMENIRLPLNVAGEIADYSQNLGDLKTHYAGLINAGHGYDPKNPEIPSHIMFEMRARDIPVVLRHGQGIATFELYPMLDEPEQHYMASRSTEFNNLASFLPGGFKK